MQPSDLQKVCQWAKSSHSPSDVYNAACRLLDQVGEFERLRRLEMFGDENHTARLAEIDRLQNLLHERTVELEQLRAKVESLTESRIFWRKFAGKLEAERDERQDERDALKAAVEGKAIVEKEHLAEILVYVFGDDDVAVVSAAARDGLLASLKVAIETPRNGAESHGDARTPQTQGASEADGENEAQEGSDG
jgi:hypothetical protein